MPTLLISFPGKRYHATPWGHHVNEGLIEWPPSPWRLLRALLATGYAKLHWPADAPPGSACTLIEKLAGTLPHYCLPPATGAHSRHFMPLAILDKGRREKTTLVFDAWAQVDEGALAVRWDVTLTEGESGVLERLATSIGYLGRSESWTVGRMIPDEPHFMERANAIPCHDGNHPGPGWEQVSLLASESAPDFAQWRERAVAQALKPFPLPENKKPSKKLIADRFKAEAPFPSDIVACLQSSTNWLRRHGWSQPPGSRRVLYWRRADSLESGASRQKRRRFTTHPVEVMLLSMATASRNDHALPNITRTLPQAELLHRALVAQALRLGKHSVALSGCDGNGRPLREPHRHAHVLPLDIDGDGHLEHILVWAPMGLDAHAEDAIRAVRRTFTKGGAGPLRLTVAVAGSLADLLGMPGLYGQRLGELTGSAVKWRSVTPFVPPRYLKKRGRNTLEGQVIDELKSRGQATPKSITVLNPHNEVSVSRYRHFVRTRRFGPAPPIDCGFGMEIHFSEPVSGPLVLGYGCHFGLGLFSSVS